MYKFEKLEVWQLSLDYCDQIYTVCEKLPEIERFNSKGKFQCKK